MFEKFKIKRNEKSELDRQIETRIEYLNFEDDADVDKANIENVERLVDIKTQLEGKKERISPNTIAAGVFSISSVVAIMIYENRHVFTTAAKNFIPKLRM